MEYSELGQRRILGRRRHVISVGCRRVLPTSRPSAHACVVSSGDDASVLEPLSRLPWLFPVAAHGETQEESAVVRSVFNRHQRGVVRCDAASVIESLGAAERPARTAEHWSLMCPDTDMHCVQVFRTPQESGTTPYHC